MVKPLVAYKQLIRRYQRLPFSASIIARLVSAAKSRFQTENGFNSKQYSSHKSLLDEILEAEQFDKIHTLLDHAFKKPELWLADFDKINYLQLKKYWPQVHLIHEITKDPVITHAYEKRLEQERNGDILMIQHFNLHDKFPPNLPPIKLMTTHDDTENAFPELMARVTKAHNFIYDNQAKITRTKVPYLEVTYPTDRFALPLHPASRDRLLREKVASIKNILREYLAIDQQELDSLRRFAIHKPDNNPDLAINVNFFRYMTRKREQEKLTLNPIVRHHLRPKKLIPADHNIRKVFRAYVMKQFYFDRNDDKYKMSPMQNFYENERSMLDAIM